MGVRCATIAVFALFQTAPAAFATYDSECIAALVSPPGRMTSVSQYWATWVEVLKRMVPPGVKLRAIDMEAFIDLVHGLELEARFTDGTSATFTDTNDSEAEMLRRLGSTNIDDVVYLPHAQRRMAALLYHTCVELQRDHCATYERYQGIAAGGRRPMSRAEELALKWSTFHMYPPRSLVEFLQHTESMDAEAKTAMLAQLKDLRLVSASHVIRSVFPAPDAERLLDRVIRPMIEASFERANSQVRGGASH